MVHMTPRPLTAAAFAPHGDVIEVRETARHTVINYGQTTRFDELADLDIAAQGGRAAMSIFRSKPLPSPVRIRVMERHPLSSQAFFPLSGRPYLVVAGGEGAFDPKRLDAFIAGPQQGVNYRRGVWHHFVLALEAESDFLVIDRAGPEQNLEEIELASDAPILIDT